MRKVSKVALDAERQRDRAEAFATVREGPWRLFSATSIPKSFVQRNPTRECSTNPEGRMPTPPHKTE
jgi:hypothetical protein